MKISKYFEAREFLCPCGCKTDTLPRGELLRAMDDLRVIVGRPINISSGIRCRSHNDKIGGALDSRHLPEHADGCDIACLDSEYRAKLLTFAFPSGITTIKIYPTHVHVDCRPGPRRVLA